MFLNSSEAVRAFEASAKGDMTRIWRNTSSHIARGSNKRPQIDRLGQAANPTVSRRSHLTSLAECRSVGNSHCPTFRSVIYEEASPRSPPVARATYGPDAIVRTMTQDEAARYMLHGATGLGIENLPSRP